MAPVGYVKDEHRDVIAEIANDLLRIEGTSIGIAVAAPFESPGNRRMPRTSRNRTANEKMSSDDANVRSAAGAEGSRKAPTFD